MEKWAFAFRIFLLGFSGVFVTLGLLMVSIYLASTLARTIKEG